MREGKRRRRGTDFKKMQCVVVTNEIRRRVIGVIMLFHTVSD